MTQHTRGDVEARAQAQTFAARRTRRVEAVKRELEADIARREVVEEYAANLVEVQVRVYPARRRRSEMHGGVAR